ncbi:uncharacterized protein HD556DRAFT_1309821 [Suillus plorans]|uniref:Uncharacterized protein n=1 Tax=Suillus plorans TaxID=116603 RepID=A0A9P7ADT3_9AGAM|nr:uncharacterized protein HD556DRAFT_1313587 [Suillus plorans]XP_041158318.1 uncharacterized protein HD556DRAFT_1309821 [Suillus plorans]KAG1786343.1 hypothetical protein HD556DRAFT_1313587 [Suillus plorans]KAG1791512.1 hypothetical protein HD556DRAFT_1309821 [Suillus plorans]
MHCLTFCTALALPLGQFPLMELGRLVWFVFIGGSRGKIPDLEEKVQNAFLEPPQLGSALQKGKTDGSKASMRVGEDTRKFGSDWRYRGSTGQIWRRRPSLKNDRGPT